MVTPVRVTLRRSRRSDEGPLERTVNKTSTTQKILHTHLQGEKLATPSSFSTAVNAPGAPGTAIGALKSGHNSMEEFQRQAKEELEMALKLQEERLQAQFKEALRSRERLEAEARQVQRVELQAQLEARYMEMRKRMEEEKRLAVQEACTTLREEMKRELEMEKEEERRVIQKQMEEHIKEYVSVAEQRVWEECKKEDEKERQALQDRHKEEVSQLQDRLQQLQDSLVQVCWERMQYEAEFKKVQASYRQFIDLTDSSLHSDYLSKLRRLGREPGLVEAATQTDDISNTP